MLSALLPLLAKLSSAPDHRTQSPHSPFPAPSSSRYSYKQRIQLLKCFSLVFECWQRFAQPELLAFVVISKPKRCFFNRLKVGPSCKTLNGLNKESLKRLLVKRRGQMGTAEAGAEMLELCKQVEEVWMKSN